MGLAFGAGLNETNPAGGVAEWLNAAVLKTVELARVPGVRIPPPPPLWVFRKLHFYLELFCSTVLSAGIILLAAQVVHRNSVAFCATYGKFGR